MTGEHFNGINHRHRIMRLVAKYGRISMSELIRLDGDKHGTGTRWHVNRLCEAGWLRQRRGETRGTPLTVSITPLGLSYRPVWEFDVSPVARTIRRHARG